MIIKFNIQKIFWGSPCMSLRVIPISLFLIDSDNQLADITFPVIISLCEFSICLGPWVLSEAVRCSGNPQRSQILMGTAVSVLFSPGRCYNVQDSSFPPLSVLLLGPLLILRFAGFLTYSSTRQREQVALAQWRVNRGWVCHRAMSPVTITFLPKTQVLDLIWVLWSFNLVTGTGIIFLYWGTEISLLKGMKKQTKEPVFNQDSWIQC